MLAYSRDEEQTAEVWYSHFGFIPRPQIILNLKFFSLQTQLIRFHAASLRSHNRLRKNVPHTCSVTLEHLWTDFDARHSSFLCVNVSWWTDRLCGKLTAHRVINDFPRTVGCLNGKSEEEDIWAQCSVHSGFVVCVCVRARVRACVRVCDERVQIGSYIWLPQSRSQRVVLFWSVCIFSFLSSECVNSAHLSLLAYLCTIKHHFASLCNRTVTSVLSCWFRREQAPSHSFRGVGYQPFCPPHSDTTRCRAVELTGVKPCE